MSESKTISLRIPENILTEIDRIAQEKYKSHKGTPNRSLVILDALESYINTSSCDANVLFASHDDVLTERVQELEKTVSRMLEDFNEFKQSIIAVSDDVNKVNILPNPTFNPDEQKSFPHQSDLFPATEIANSEFADKGLSGEELAKKIGVVPSTLSNKKKEFDNLEKFVDWTRSVKGNMEKVGWEYRKKSKGKGFSYYPVGEPLA
jgi:lambda repressor-like predicted transcriptional regulator